ncbi:MAG: hypothetical protein JST22_18870 [Bacteroidetes bacterium]|nr:hypothetical protein [Bacteroidota bacterium]
MTRSRNALVHTLLCLLPAITIACATQRAERSAVADPPAPSIVPAAQQAVPSGRAALVVPDSLWDEAVHQLMPGGGPLGFTADQVLSYNPDPYVLRTVWSLYRNARAVPRFTGQVSQGLLENAGAIDGVVQRGFSLTDISAGRMMPLLADSIENLRWYGAVRIDRPEAFDSLVAYYDTTQNHVPVRAVPDTVGMPDPSIRARWAALPTHARLLIARLLVAIDEAGVWLAGAYSDDARAVLDRGQTFGASSYAMAKAPWSDERLGQSATPDVGALRLLDYLDRRRLAFASTVLFTQVAHALREFRSADSLHPVGAMNLAGFELETASGLVRVLGTGNDTVAGSDAVLTIDLGGDDHYLGRLAATKDPGQICLAVDCSGNDVYECAGEPAALACGLFGIGALFDLSGNDRYHVSESGLGCAWYGTGVLQDFAGDDEYVTDGTWGQGAAHIGVGALVDLAGNDRYTCGSESQGLGSTLGAGILLDVAGNDRYVARDDGAISELYLGQSVSMSQGCGFGRRADLGDGASLAGGVGALVDGAGDDYYSAPVWSQGAGYWWGLGMLEDRSGNDVYRSGKYSIGAAAHYAIGCKVDLEGNDVYAVGYDGAMNQYLGHARDGSIGISIDGAGDDSYLLKLNCGGSADLCSIGLMWDRSGNDTYNIDFRPTQDQIGWTDTPPLGSATYYPTPFNSFRDDVGTFGLFLDTGGKDTYVIEAKGSRDVPFNPDGADGTSWRTHRAMRSVGFGWDIDWYR